MGIDTGRFGTNGRDAFDSAAGVQSIKAMPLQTDEHVVQVRKQVREQAIAIGLSLVDQTKLVTAASELARNTLKYGGGGEATLEILDGQTGPGLRVAFIDRGPGIADIARALTDGFTSGGGLGLGLGGARRLVDEFSVVSAPGEGTTVTVLKWKR
jgi:serine/threonine-protein kinase RsbT